MTHNSKHSQLIFDHSNDAIMITDRNNKIITVNSSFEKYTQYKKEDILGKNPRFLKSGKHNNAFYKQMWSTINEHGIWEGEIWNKTKNNQLYPEWLTIIVHKNDYGEIDQYIAIFKDLTKQKKLEQKLDYFSNYDQFTGLNNKIQFTKQIDKLIQSTQRNKNKFAVVLLDLDKLKYVNDTYGNQVGDKAILEVTKRLKQTIRSEDSIARIDGDEFGFLISNITLDNQLTVALERIIKSINEPLFLNAEKPLHLTCSIGISIYPDDGDNSKQLINNSNTALYNAKKTGNTFTSYKKEYSNFHKKQLEIYKDLKHAIFNKELEVYYQPQIDIKKNKITGIEALVRWNSKILGFINPEEFIKVSEEFGLILNLTEFVFDKAMKDFKSLQKKGYDGKLSLNLSPKQLNSKKIVDTIEKLLFQNNINPVYIEMEVTENAIIENVTLAREVLNELKKLGISISIDDFGTGATSLLHLQELPIDKIKIDKKFVDNLEISEKDMMIVKTIIQLSHNMNYQVIVEGVESIKQVNILKSLKCSLFQGYIFSKPLDINKLSTYLTKTLNTDDLFLSTINNIKKHTLNISQEELSSLTEEINRYKKELINELKKTELAQMKYQNSYNEFRRIFDSAPIGYCIINDTLHIEKENQHFKSIINFTGHNYLNLYFQEDSDNSFKSWIKRIDDNQVYSKTFKLIDGISYVIVHARLFEQGIQKRYFISLSDVTSEIKKTEELHKLNTKLNEIVEAEVSKNLAQEKQYFEQQLKNSQFSTIGKMAAGLTHEINTPLTVIKGNVDLLLYDLESLEDQISVQNATGTINKINENIKRISLVTNSLKELSETNQEVKKETNLYETLFSALQFIFARSKHISKIYVNDELFPNQISLNKPIFNSSVQAQRIEQVWIAILNNALDELIKKNSYEDRKIEIFIKDNEHDNIINFIDNGNGIDESIFNNLFEPLVSGKASSGIGIGLNMCRKVINDHSGSININNSTTGINVEIKIPKIIKDIS